MIQRHHDYVLGPNQDARLASVAAGQTITGIPLTTDSDAPFVLRSRAMRVRYDESRHQTGNAASGTGLNHLLMRWSGPDRDYRAQSLVRQSLYGPYFGQIGNPIPVHPQVVYPRQSTLMVDVSNDGSDVLTNLTLYFRGVKLFSPDAVKSYTYPPSFGLLPFIYPQGTYSDTDGYTLVRNIQVTQGPLRQTFKVKGDADFVFRAGQAGLSFSDTPPFEIFIRLRDEDEKPYSNDAVHLDVMFGNSHFGGVYSGIAPIAGGPNSPGLIYPEIYIPKNHLMYFDITRSDAYVAGAGVVHLPLQFIGQKVFAK
jgi:hypothetical protein